MENLKHFEHFIIFEKEYIQNHHQQFLKFQSKSNFIYFNVYFSHLFF